MKVLIDIPEEIYKASKIIDVQYEDIVQIPLEVIAKGTPIPDNATNGDIIQTMFPNADIEIHNITVYVIFDMRSNVISFDLDWWNALYQKGGK